MPIELLRPEVSSKIAAGEVIEHPASAVKELVENALDAGARRIRIELRGGGIDYIRVTDDGGGIPPEQVELAFQRFATSKLTDAEDLESVSTLGFRGEALPSIAAISRVEMRTRTPDSDAGFRIEIKDGETLESGPVGAPVGTSIIVRRLFDNFPARRKFLRAPNSEQTRLQTLISLYALAYPEIVFELSAERGRPFASPGSGSLRDAAAAVYGRQIAESMIRVSTGSDSPDTRSNESDEEPSLHGLITPPTVNRANRRNINLFVNGRLIQNQSLVYAVVQSYHGFMAERRYPVAALNIRMPLREVDVNAHPAKTEVRFRHENRAFGIVQRAVRAALIEHSPVPEVGHRSISPTPSTSASSGSGTRSTAAFWPTTPFSSNTRGQQQATQSAGRFDSLIEPSQTPPEARASTDTNTTPRQALPILRVLGQVQNTYVIAEGPDGVFMIDQHAAHERVMFERVMAPSADGAPEAQNLLDTALVELDDAHMELALARMEVISGMGFVLEQFGDNAIMLRAIPALLTDSDPARALVDVLDMMQDGGEFESWEERAAYSIACHGAIRAGKVMSMDEMRELVRQLERCAQPNTCPHGRPTMIHMSAGRLEREFGRS